MSVVISDHCYCLTGYGVLVEVDSGEVGRAYGRLPQATASTRTAGRVVTVLRRMRAAFGGRRTASEKRSA